MKIKNGAAPTMENAWPLSTQLENAELFVWTTSFGARYSASSWVLFEEIRRST